MFNCKNVRLVCLIHCRCVLFDFWGEIAVVWGKKVSREKLQSFVEKCLNVKVVQTPSV